MKGLWLIVFAGLFAVLLLNFLTSQRLELAILAPLLSIPCIMAVLVGALSYGVYAIQFGQAIDGRFVLPKNNRWLASVIRLWIACLIVAVVAGIPSILYLESVVRKYKSNDEQERIGPVVPREPSI